ncbi:MAG: hypothetical protein EOS46_23085, partial [Mesorhizobium sp.]
PHCPAGHFSPYSDGEKAAVIGDFANCLSRKKGAEGRDSILLPVTIRGEGAGRRMRGGASLKDGLCRRPLHPLWHGIPI